MTETKIPNYIPASSKDIAEQLGAIAQTLSRLESEAVRLSFAAVSGDAIAANALAQINAEVERASGDRIVLERAKVAALQLEDSAKEDAEEVRKQEHYRVAVQSAVKLVELCEQMDARIEEFAKGVLQMQTTEKEIWSALRMAGRKPEVGVSWRNGIHNLAFANVENCFAAGDFRSVPISQRVRVGWSLLLADAVDTGGQ